MVMLLILDFLILLYMSSYQKTSEDKEKWLIFLNISLDDLEKRTHKLKDENPMLGHRGCRLGVSYPELYRMQAKAIIEAAYEISKKG